MYDQEDNKSGIPMRKDAKYRAKVRVPFVKSFFMVIWTDAPEPFVKDNCTDFGICEMNRTRSLSGLCCCLVRMFRVQQCNKNIDIYGTKAVTWHALIRIMYVLKTERKFKGFGKHI